MNKAARAMSHKQICDSFVESKEANRRNGIQETGLIATSLSARTDINKKEKEERRWRNRRDG